VAAAVAARDRARRVRLRLRGKSRVQVFSVLDPHGETACEVRVDEAEGLNADVSVAVPAASRDAIWSVKLDSPQGMYTPGFSVADVPPLPGVGPGRMLVLDEQTITALRRPTRRVQVNGEGALWIEAEQMRGFGSVVPVDGASGEGAALVRPLPGWTDQDRTLAANVETGAGTWHVWVRLAPRGPRAWYRVAVDGERLTHVSLEAESSPLAWERAGEAELQAGVHQPELTLSRVAADAVLLTTDADLSPTSDTAP